MEAVTARSQVLGKEIDAQKDKIATLQSALANASESFGENDKRTLNWATHTISGLRSERKPIT